MMHGHETKESDSIENLTNIPDFPKSLPGSFWGIAVFFNPTGYKNKLRNYRVFRKSNKIQGLKLLTVELAFGDAYFELAGDDADILIQLRTDAVLWQKERLLNIGLKNLPKDCDKVAWLDADIIFKNNNWIAETSNLLERYIVVQPFSIPIRLPKGAKYNADADIIEMDSAGDINEFGIEKKMINVCSKDCLGWAARKHIFNRNGFYDKLIYGGGCITTRNAFYGDKINFDERFGKKLSEDIKQWSDNMRKKVRGSVYNARGVVFHLWHSSSEKKHYYARQVLKDYDFDPDKDIEIASNGCWIWTSDKTDLHKSVRDYFWFIDEDDKGV